MKASGSSIGVFRGLVVVGILLGAVGCSGPASGGAGGREIGAGKTMEVAREAVETETPGFSEHDEIVAEPGLTSLARTTPIAEWVALAFEAVDDASVQAIIAMAVLGHERAFFMEVLARAANETRDVGAAVRGAAAGLAWAGGTAEASIGVREIWARECCMRRSFLAEGLLGLVDGLEGRGAVSVQETATALSLGELSEHRDPAVAAAAREALRFFTVEEPGN